MNLSLDPNPMSLIQAQAKYGEIRNGVWGAEKLWCQLYEISDDLCSTWINSITGRATTHIYCNKDLAPHLLAALSNLKNENILRELKTFDGCHMIRDVRSYPGIASAHSYGIAIDVNASENRLGQIPKLTPQFVECWKRAGFIWGGDFKRKDGMHFSLGW